MVSAGLDTVPGNLIMGIATLSSNQGQEIQKKAYEEIMKIYPDGDAWEKCLVEEKVPYITALVREVLRFYTIIPICLPRTSIKDIQYEDAIIPAGTTFYMVNIKTDDSVLLLTGGRILGQQITMQHISRTRNPLSQNDTWMYQKFPGSFTTRMGLGPACAQDSI
jgi:Cytochrome P450